ncbi:MAG TPA: hypothetical protein VM032_03185 [Vicinamibacterales bacterium]|nr:hypothetical protein [Vicinamibacterales bacterium]
MSLSKIGFLWGVVGLLLVQANAHGQRPPARVPLVSEDRFVVRSMQIVGRSGGPVAAVQALEGVDLAQGTLQLRDVFGRPRPMPLADLDRIEFSQRPRSQAPMEQSAPWRIDTAVGPLFARAPNQPEYVTADLTIHDGALTLPDLPEPQVAASSVQAPGPAPAEALTTWELVTIRYDAPSKQFRIALRPARYEKRFLGGGSSGGGAGKGRLP